jgi:hypothetical protein
MNEYGLGYAWTIIVTQDITGWLQVPVDYGGTVGYSNILKSHGWNGLSVDTRTTTARCPSIRCPLKKHDVFRVTHQPTVSSHSYLYKYCRLRTGHAIFSSFTTPLPFFFCFVCAVEATSHPIIYHQHRRHRTPDR